MKQLKFRQPLADLVIAGKKTSTWRLFDEKNLQVGDEVEFLIWESLKPFGNARVTNVRHKTLGALDASDMAGHETFESREQLLKTYRKYYDQDVDFDTKVKVIDFNFKPL